MHKIIFLDTNIFLHYQPFTQINWLEIVNAKTATIVIPPVTIRELNKHKDSHPRFQIKKRAGDTIQKLSELLDIGTTARISDNVSVLFEDRDPTIDFVAHQLNFNIQDDHLIASILLNKQERIGDYIVLITSDLGLALVSKAGRQGINTQKMPVNFRIPEEPDPSESKVRQLEQQIRELNSRTPNLSLVYENGEQHAAFKLPQPRSLEQTEINLKINELKVKYPKRSKAGENDQTNQSISIPESLSRIAAMSLMGAIPEEEIARYNEEVENYLSGYASFILRKNDYENLKRRTISLDLALANDGTSPAEDIDIYLHFPDGFLLSEEDELPKPPAPPKQPVEPMTQMQQLARSMQYNQMVPLSSYFNSASNVSPVLPENVSGPSIKRTNSYEVQVHVQKIKHNLQLPLDPLFVTFDSYKTASSFNIDYRILAANIPREVTGSMHIIIEKA